ncbi:MAG: Crp/Fnr family transcriptional regulator [Nitrospinota bacterium]
MSLKGINLFEGLDDTVLEGIEKLASRREFKKGELLFMEGDEPACLWLILDGEVKVFKEFASGKSAILGIFGPGSAVGAVAVIDGNSYPAGGQAATAGTAFTIKRDDVLNVITSNPSIALRMMSDMGKKLRDLTGDLGSMSVQSVIRRLSRLLVKLAEKLGTVSGNDVEMGLFLTRKDLAECIGTSFEVAVRGLRKLQDEKLIEIEGKKLIVRDMNKLREAAK